MGRRCRCGVVVYPAMLVSTPRVLFPYAIYRCQCGRRFSIEPLPSIISTLVGGVASLASAVTIAVAASSSRHGREYLKAAAILGAVGVALVAFGVWQGWTRKRFPEAS